MDSQFASAVELLDVSKNFELSPNGWGLWGVKRDSVLDSCSTSRDLFPGTHSVADSLSSFGEMPNRNLWRSYIPSAHMDFQFDSLQNVGQGDDIFWNSALENFPENGEMHGPFCSCPDCWSEVSPAGNSWLIPSDMPSEKQQVMKSSCSSGTQSWGGDNTAPQSVPCDIEQETAKAPSVNILVPSEQSGLRDHPTEEMTQEETVLHDLESVMTQLSAETRICFRDALYRLAENSTKQHHVEVPGQNEKLDKENPPPLARHNQDCSDRSGTRMVESETNIIDRAVANIIFNRMDFNHDFTVKPPDICEGEAHGSDVFQYQNLESSMFPDDHEVPVFTQGYLNGMKQPCG